MIGYFHVFSYLELFRYKFDLQTNNILNELNSLSLGIFNLVLSQEASLCVLHFKLKSSGISPGGVSFHQFCVDFAILQLSNKTIV